MLPNKYKIFLIRSEGNIKNKFYGGIRKSLRRINQIYKTNVFKANKLIKYSALTRVLDIKDKPSSLPQALKEDALTLREKIVAFAHQELTDDNAQEVIDFCKDLFKFNLSSRCYRIKRYPKKRPFSRYEDVK